MTFETRRRYAVRDDLEPRRGVDRRLALLLGLGHPSVVELPGHAGLFGAAHGCGGAAVAGGDGATAACGGFG